MFGGEVNPLAGSGYSLLALNPTREGQLTTLLIDGPPGDLVWVWLSAAPVPIFLPQLRAPLLLDVAGLVAIPFGPIPSSGQIQLVLTAPSMPAGIEVRSLYMQVMGFSPVDGATGGAGHTVLLLDDSL